MFGAAPFLFLPEPDEPESSGSFADINSPMLKNDGVRSTTESHRWLDESTISGRVLVLANSIGASYERFEKLYISRRVPL